MIKIEIREELIDWLEEHANLLSRENCVEFAQEFVSFIMMTGALTVDNEVAKDDTRPFPIQGDRILSTGRGQPSTIPWWLAEEAYKEYLRRCGRHGSQTLERLAERGGFGRKELLRLLMVSAVEAILT